MVKDYRRMTPAQREADRERRRQGRERRAAEKEAKIDLRSVRKGMGTSHVPQVDAFMRRDWREGYQQEAQTFPDLDDETQGMEDGTREADRTWAHAAAHLVRSEMPQLQMSLADLIEVAPIRRRRGGKKGKRAAEADDGYSVLGSEAGTEMWSEMGEEELASVLAALDEEAEEEWEQLGADEVPAPATTAVEAKTVETAR